MTIKHLQKKRTSDGRIVRWTHILSAYAFELVHISGKLNTIADTLSHHPDKSKHQTQNLDQYEDKDFEIIIDNATTQNLPKQLPPIPSMHFEKAQSETKLYPTYNQVQHTATTTTGSIPRS